MTGVQRFHRVLKDHLYIAPDRHQLLARPGADVLALEQNLAAGRLIQAGNAAPQRGLATSRFTNQPQRFARPQGQTDTVDSLVVFAGTHEYAFLDREVHLQVPHLKNRRLTVHAHGETSGSACQR